jgi:hypothetical protein
MRRTQKENKVDNLLLNANNIGILYCTVTAKGLSRKDM